MNKAILLLDATGLTVWYARGKQLSAGPHFEFSPAGLAEFARWTELAAGISLRMLVDTSDESFDIEVLPRLSAKDRRAFVTRRQAQLSQGSSFFANLAIKASANKEHRSRMLFLALSRPDTIEPWLACLRNGEAQLQDVVTPPLLAPDLLPIALRKRPQVLLCIHTSAGLRQTLVQDGTPVFSRLIPVGPDVAWQVRVAEEIRRSRQYFIGQRLIRREDVLPVALYCARDDFENFGTGLTSEPLNLHWIDAEAPEGDGLVRLIRAAALAKPPAQFAPAADRKIFRHNQLRLSTAFGAALLAAAMLVSAGRVVLAREDRLAETQALLQANTTRAQTLAQLRATLPTLPGPLGEVESALVRVEALRTQASLPLHSLRDAGNVLAEHPELSLNQIEWTVAEPGQAPGPQTKPTAPSLHLVLKGQGPAGSESFSRLPEALRLHGATKASLHKAGTTGDGQVAFVAEADFPEARQ